MRSPTDPSAGPIISGLIATNLEDKRLDRFHAVEAPVLWRLVVDKSKVLDPDKKTAAEVARQMGAQAVLTGSAQHATTLGNVIRMRGASAKAQKSAEFMRNFAHRKGNIRVQVEILSADSGQAIYVHSTDAKGLQEAGLLRKVADKIVEPLIKHLEKTRGKRKEAAK